MFRLLLLMLFLGSFATAHATHVMGGEITWKCSGNGYVFRLVFYRDCNGADVNPVSENLQIWNNPNLSTIPVHFVSRTDISPTCTAVAGGPPALTCGIGANGGNGLGAIEKVVYESNPINLTGTPPAAGWIITYSNYSLNAGLTNISNPLNYGITVKATMFAIPGSTAGVCSDNSPQFLQDPYFVICSGEQYLYNLNPVDNDLDSLVTVFGQPLDRLQGTSYNPPSDPDFVPFAAGFSYTNPTPDASMNAGNVPASLDPLTSALSLKSFTSGAFLMKFVVQSYRNGVLIAEVEREVELLITSCSGANNAPVVPGPFGGLYETTVIAGTPVNFTLTSTDLEVLQDGTPQMNYLSASGNEFGTNFTSTTGCDVAPCATLDQTPLISGIQGVSTDFSWQTDCAHLVDAFGNFDDQKDFTFVFKVQDNYCQIPKTTFQTITIHVVNPGIVAPTQITCITTQANGDVTVTWDPIQNVNGTFQSYDLYSLQNGLMGSFPIGTTSITIPNPGMALDFYIGVKSGCNIVKYSDTVANVFLDILNPGDGTAVLDWNVPGSPIPAGLNATCDVLREYPAGTWTTIATLPFTTTHFVDTIDICSANLNYQIVYSSPTCNWNSNSIGDLFFDKITPDIPIISSASIDTLTGNVVLTWNQNYQPDTYGYVIYWKDANGFIVEIDTVWGITNTSYTYSTPVTGPLTYSVAAFDSCYTPATPPTHQTSAKAELHTTMFLTHDVNSCSYVANLTWTAYEGWGTGLVDYTIFARSNGGTWQQVGTSNTASFVFNASSLVNYQVAVRANGPNGNESFSNVVAFVINGPRPPSLHYLRVASVENGGITLRHEISVGTNIQAVRFEKYNWKKGLYEFLVELPATTATLTYVDTDVDVNTYSYQYRAFIIDSCGNKGFESNHANSVLLKVNTDQTSYINHLYWTPYSVYDGGVLSYLVFRGIDGIMDPNPCAVLAPNQLYFDDYVGELLTDFSGKVCYVVVAKEAINQYGIQEYARSNELCPVFEPLVYIPNAFTPGGANPIFIPVVTFQDVSKYEFSIVDRWGQLIFQTNDPLLGWDGIHQLSGELVAPNTYVYVLKVVDGNNQEYFFRGHVSVIR